jgi:uncharacterized membrane protein
MIVGEYWDGSNHNHAYILNGGTYTSLNVPGAIASFAQGINDGGTIVGYYGDASGHIHGFEAIPAPVPIPGAVWLLGSGLIGLVGIRRRFKQ